MRISDVCTRWSMVVWGTVVGVLLGTSEALVGQDKNPEVVDTVAASLMFETAENIGKFEGAFNTPNTIEEGSGAMGSTGFIRVGPHTDSPLGLLIKASTIVAEESFLSFSMRMPRIWFVRIETMNATTKKRFSLNFRNPAGKWITFRRPLTHMGLRPGERLGSVRIRIDNARRETIYADLDNIVVATKSSSTPVASAPLELTGKMEIDHVRLEWKSPVKTLLGVMEYRVLRGLSPNFLRTRKYNAMTTSDAGYSDSRFSQEGVYYYAVQAVDFAGRPGEISKPISIDTLGN